MNRLVSALEAGRFHFITFENKGLMRYLNLVVAMLLLFSLELSAGISEAGTSGPTSIPDFTRIVEARASLKNAFVGLNKISFDYKVALPDDRAAVLAPIKALFAGMLAADTTGLSDLFHPTAQLMTVMTDEQGQSKLRQTAIPAFIQSLSRAQPNQLREELCYFEVRIDNDLATVWTPYVFHFQDKISHCGTNAFQLARTGEENSWQIIRITDNRSPEPCPDYSDESPEESLDAFATAWHRAAAITDAEQFFGSMADGAIYIGTDAGEHWTKKEFYTFAKPYFDKGKAWDFTARERHLFVNPDENIAYWDELLNTWMGPCRGTGIVKRQTDGSWKLLHYTLSVTVPNDQIKAFLKLGE
ncbi:hypothetical protein CEQ90_14515 [Lewinellaceae bacterium SD302]|nr:hypothetical protein CEQ90_14515 [Lewinellaceae bacterium SD302]